MKKLNNGIMYRIIEERLLELYNNDYYEIVDKCEFDANELEFLNENSYDLMMSYNVMKDDNEYYLVIIIEEDRILYLILDEQRMIINEKSLSIENIFN